MRTLKLAGALKRQAPIPWQGIGVLSPRRSPADRAGAHPFSTPYSVEQADPDPRHGAAAHRKCPLRARPVLFGPMVTISRAGLSDHPRSFGQAKIIECFEELTWRFV